MDIQNNDKEWLCRSCLVLNYLTIPLNSKYNDNLSLWTMYHSITNIEPTDSPSDFRICVKCSKILVHCYNFQQNCIKSNNIYERNLHNSQQNDCLPELAITTIGENVGFEMETDDIFEDALEISEEGCIQLISNSELNILNSINENIDIKQEDCDGDLLVIVESDKDDDNKNESEEQNSTEGASVRKIHSQFFPAEQVTKAIREYKESKNYWKSCILCQVETVSHIALSGHMSIFHREHKGKWCHECNLVVDDLEDHKIGHSDTDIFCKFCTKFIRRTNYISHLQTHMEKKPYECKVCKKGFIRLSTLRMHVKRHIRKPQFKCPICSISFTDGSDYRLHVLGHGSYKCETCSMRFRKKVQLIKHNCSETKTKTVNDCDNEEKQEINDDDIDIEKARELFGDKAILPNFCEICNHRVKDIIKHTELIHSKAALEPEGPDFVCAVCEKTYGSAQSLRKHYRCHQEGAYTCSYCGKKCPTPFQLKSHQRKHTKEKPFICSECGKSFGQVSSLRTHVIGHGEKPEVCEICNKRFCKKAQLNLHMKLHQGIKPFLCPQCGKSFLHKGHLTDHLRTHSEERPFECPFCQKCYKSKPVLNIHLTIHTGKKLFKCEKCPYSCSTKYRLLQHGKQHNNKG